MFSPSIVVVSSWLLKKEHDMKVKHTDDDPINFDHHGAESLHEILATQEKKTENTNDMLEETISHIIDSIKNIWPLRRQQ